MIITKLRFQIRNILFKKSIYVVFVYFCSININLQLTLHFISSWIRISTMDCVYWDLVVDLLVNPQDLAQEAVKKRRRATKKPYSRSIVGATLEVIQKRRTEKAEVRDAAREAALRSVFLLLVISNLIILVFTPIISLL